MAFKSARQRKFVMAKFRSQGIKTFSPNPKVPFTERFTTKSGKTVFLNIFPENPKLNNLQIGIGPKRKIISIKDREDGIKKLSAGFKTIKVQKITPLPKSLQKIDNFEEHFLGKDPRKRKDFKFLRGK